MLSLTMLEEIIKRAQEELLSREQARDEAYRRARKARTMSKQAILLLHSGETGKAASNLGEAKRIIAEIDGYVEAHPEIAFYDAVTAAKEEYSEACILYDLNTGNSYPKPETIGVSIHDYIMGLADVPGELRRQTLDLLRAGDLDSAERNLATMEEIYLNLVSVEEVSLFLKGLRRKLDVTRNVNERTRAEITTEASRESLRKKLTEVGERLL
jgi:translin